MPTQPGSGEHDRRGPQVFETGNNGGSCAPRRATEAITAIIPRIVLDIWHEMDRCLRGPGLTEQEAEIASLLRSIRIAKSD